MLREEGGIDRFDLRVDTSVRAVHPQIHEASPGSGKAHLRHKLVAEEILHQGRVAESIVVDHLLDAVVGASGVEEVEVDLEAGTEFDGGCRRHERAAGITSPSIEMSAR
jgi:hypothetical protein